MEKYSQQKIEILDTTLREGEQTPGISFSHKEKIKIAKMLNEFGADFIELGHPAVSKDIYKSINMISHMKLESKKIVHSRLIKKDIDLAIELKIPWVGLFIGTSNLCLKHKYQIGKDQLLRMIESNIKYCKDKGLKVRFTAEDSSRTNIIFLNKVAYLAQKSGADRFSFADTVGILRPLKMQKIIKSLKYEIDIPIHVHCHNDFGLATANSLAAIESGAQCIDTTINGLGERCGLPPLAEITAALSKLYKIKNNWDLGMLKNISDYIDEITGMGKKNIRPITGDNAFTHKAGLHVNSILKDPSCYEAITPKFLNRDRKILIDKYSGKANIKHKLNKLGICLSESKIENLLISIKSKPSTTNWTDEMIISTIKQIDKLSLNK
tara:strand:+ start:48 stop:1190 length:1143 start_codon:yes stop_codon:yes gene_type:complete